jgi:hemoglobin-like flavoprotein
MSIGADLIGATPVDDQPDRQRIHDHRLLQESLTLIAPVADDVIRTFYDRLFLDYPEVRPMFPAVLDLQREQLLTAIIALVTHYDQPEQLTPALSAMGRRHQGYGVRLEHYGAVGSTLLATLESFAGPAWTPAVATAWERAYTFAAGIMSAAGTLDGTGVMTTDLPNAGGQAGSEPGQLAA